MLTKISIDSTPKNIDDMEAIKVTMDSIITDNWDEINKIKANIVRERNERLPSAVKECFAKQKELQELLEKKEKEYQELHQYIFSLNRLLADIRGILEGVV